MKIIFIITLFEIIYIYYILNIFKTTYTIHHPLEYAMINELPNYFKHPIGKYEYSNKICPFGHFASKLLILYLAIRYILLSYKIRRGLLYKINFIILIITLLLSLLNMNAFTYLIPYFLVEIYNIILW
jgi:hypothetical protein